MYDVKDERGVPVSGGIPPIVIVAFLVGALLIFVVGGMVLSVSRYGHVWPSTDSSHIKL